MEFYFFLVNKFSCSGHLHGISMYTCRQGILRLLGTVYIPAWVLVCAPCGCVAASKAWKCSWYKPISPTPLPIESLNLYRFDFSKQYSSYHTTSQPFSIFTVQYTFWSRALGQLWQGGIWGQEELSNAESARRFWLVKVRGLCFNL